MKVISRFAPSPTGYLHIGGVRTALYSWLHAKQTNGKFILRIEDTDRERSTEEAIQVILDGMQWLGMDYDGPYYQTQRMERYKEVIDYLLSKNLAYKCYCSKERVDKLREEQLQNKQKPKYDGYCRDKDNSASGNNENCNDKNATYVIRFKNPQDGHVEFVDRIRGRVVIQNAELDDLIIQRTDGYPTYNFAVVVDDWDMGITEVIRGEDHINNTPRQINIFAALGAKAPMYAHVPMILGSDGKKLSKRHGALSVLEYKVGGYLPEALLNYLLRLGFSSGDKEIFSKEEMISLFTLDNVSKSAAAFDEAKLNWLNQHYIKNLPSDYIATHLELQFDLRKIDLSNGPKLANVVELLKDRSVTLFEMADKAKYFYSDEIDFNEDAIKQHFSNEVQPAFKSLLVSLEELSDTNWNKDNIKEIINNKLKEFNIKMPKLAQPIRIAITGDTNSPSIDATLALVGKNRTVNRLQQSMQFFK